MALIRRGTKIPFRATTIELRKSSTKLTKIDLHYLSNRMEYDRGNKFSFDFEPNENPFGSKIETKTVITIIFQ